MTEPPDTAALRALADRADHFVEMLSRDGGGDGPDRWEMAEIAAALRHAATLEEARAQVPDWEKLWTVDRAEKAERERDAARAALEKSVELQSHYAALLNGYDGGERLLFGSAQEWIDRLRKLQEPTP